MLTNQILLAKVGQGSAFAKLRRDKAESTNLVPAIGISGWRLPILDLRAVL